MMIGAATVMPTQIIADHKLVIHATSVIMYSQVMKVKSTSIAEFVKLEWVQVKIWTNIAKIIQIIADLKPVIHATNVIMYSQAMKVKIIITVMYVMHQ